MEDGRKLVVLQWNKAKKCTQEEQSKKLRIFYGDWAQLPAPAVDLILDKLNLYDYVNFGAVCVPWRSIALDERNHRGIVKKNQPWEDNHQLPLLMAPSGKGTTERFAGFYSVTRKSLVSGYKLKAPFYKQRLIGSSCGWILSVDTTFSITISKPLSPSSPPIRLPPLLNLKQLKQDNVGSEDTDNIELFGMDNLGLYQHNSCYYIAKAILSADPAKDCVVMVIYGISKKLAFIRHSSSSPRWIYVDSPMQDGFNDVIYCKSTGLFHALSEETGEVCSIKIDDDGDGYDCCITATSLEIKSMRYDHNYLRYIVETCEGDLLQVVRSLSLCKVDGVQIIRNMKYSTSRTTDFRVYKLTEKGREWREVTELGDNALFLGDSASVSVAPSQFPKSFITPGNIYFLLPYFLHHVLFGRQINVSDMGVANIKQKPGGAQPFQFHQLSYTISILPPIWIIPTFQGTPP